MSDVLIIKSNFIFAQKPEKLETSKQSFLVVEDGRIEGIYPQLPEKWRNNHVMDYSGNFVIPGFVDLHLHASQFLQCGIGMTKQLLDWLEDYTFELEAKYNDTVFAREAYSLFADKLAASGTLSSCIFASSSTKGTEILVEQLKRRGLRAYVGKVNMDCNAPENIIETTRESLDSTRYFVEKYRNEPLVRPIITPRFAPTCTGKLLAGLGELASSYNIPVQSHLSENMQEIEWVKNLFEGCDSYSDVYMQNGLFGQTKTCMAHAIHLTPEERELVRQQNVFLVHCPDSNLNVRSGIMPVREYLKMDIPLGLASDVAGGHKLFLGEAVVRAIQLSKLVFMGDDSLEPLSFPEAFYLGTKGGGKFFGDTGSFEKGYFFDALVIEDEPVFRELYSLEDRLEKFVYTGDDRNITACFVEGKRIDKIFE